jgi:hypothetical protein
MTDTLSESGPTRKHFREVANTVRAIEANDKREEFAKHHADIFQRQNPRFDRRRFMDACGVPWQGYNTSKRKPIGEAAEMTTNKAPDYVEHILVGTIEQKPADVSQAFADSLRDRLRDMAWDYQDNAILNADDDDDDGAPDDGEEQTLEIDENLLESFDQFLDQTELEDMELILEKFAEQEKLDEQTKEVLGAYVLQTVQEGEQIDEKNWIKNAIKHPSRETRAAHRAKESTHEYEEKHQDLPGSAGKAARLGLRLARMNRK